MVVSDRVQIDKRVRREERRSQLLDAAVDAIREHGAGVTMEQLRAGGVTKPILYRHFGDRDGLVSSIARVFAVRLTESDHLDAGRERAA